jgi:hypothetical protein
MDPLKEQVNADEEPTQKHERYWVEGKAATGLGEIVGGELIFDVMKGGHGGMIRGNCVGENEGET